MSFQSSSPMVARSVSLALVLLACTVATSVAGAISYGDIPANTLIFLGVTEDSATDPVPPALYGAPDVADDSLVFGPTGLAASSAVGAPNDSTNGQLNTDLLANPGYYLDMVSVEEAGGYTLAGTGTTATKAEASATLSFTIIEVNGVGIVPVTITKDMTFSPKASGDFNLENDRGIGVIWSGEAVIDVPAEAAAKGVFGPVTKAQLEIHNILLAASEAYSMASIAKNQFAINVGTGIIPEPSSLCLLGMGVIGLACSWKLRRRLGLVAALLALVLLAGGSAAIADPISYADVEGTTVWFLSPTENSITDTPPLYGSPTPGDDALTFSPVSFSAFAQNPNPPIDLTDGVLTMLIKAKAGFTIPQVLVSEEGAYTLTGSGTAATQVSVGTPTFVTILEVNGVAIKPLSFNQSMVYTPNANGMFDLANDAGSTVPWQGTALLDIQAFLASKGIQGGATKVRFSMDNTLLAISEPGTGALITKNSVIIQVIPEPSTLVLLGMGLVALVLARLRRR